MDELAKFIGYSAMAFVLFLAVATLVGCAVGMILPYDSGMAVGPLQVEWMGWEPVLWFPGHNH
jgi:hypothetical protein